jgi:molybdopterin-guanine dinucleotide biosynthesis protein A
MLAVDLPFVTPALLEYLIGRARDSTSAGATVARIGGRSQPLCAVYRREFGDAAESALRAGRYKIGALFDVARTLVVGEDELIAAGFAPAMFHNLNTPGDVAEAAVERAQAGAEKTEILRGKERRSG